MKLSEVIRAVQTDLPITMRHERWLAKNANPHYTAESAAFAAQALSGKWTNRPRMLFRSSATGMCARRRIYSAIGIAEADTSDSKMANIFHTGNFLHLKWQLAGLTEGWLKEAEVIADNPAIRFGGTLDGLIVDGSGFEFKTINSRAHTFTWKDPKEIHVRQVHAYMYLRPDIERFSIIYENKDTAEWREMRVEKDEKIIHSIDREVHELNQAFEDRKLPPVLPDCAKQIGTQYRQCPFSDICIGMKRWPAVMHGKPVGS